MVLETPYTLDEQTIRHLKLLVRLNFDSRDGLQIASEQLPVEATAIRALFHDVAMQRAAHVEELNKLVSLNDEDITHEGSFAALLHRSIVAIRDLFSNEHDPYAVLAEAERGEDAIKQAYEVALKKIAGSAVTSLLNHQYASTKKTHDRIKMLRDSAKQ